MQNRIVRVTAKDKARKAGFNTPESRRELGADIIKCIQMATEDPRNIAINDRRKRLRAQYDGDPIAADKESQEANVTPIAIPVMRPRIRQRAESLARSITSMDPPFLVTEVDRKTSAEIIENILRQAWNNIRQTWIMWQIAETGLVELAVPMMVQPLSEEDGHANAAHNGEFVGPMLEAISPRHFFRWPLRPGPLMDCRIHGHVFDMMDYEIQMLQESGVYLESANIRGSSDSITNQPKPDGEQDKSITADGVVRTYDVIYLHVPKRYSQAGSGDPSDKARKLRCILTEQGEVLSVEVWDHPVSLFVYIQPEIDLECAISGNGASSDMQPLQNVVNQMGGEIIHAAALLNDPPLGEEVPMGQKPMQGRQYHRGQRIPLGRTGEIQQVKAGAPMDALIATINLFVQFAEGASQTSSAISNMMNPHETTATEESIRFQGFQMASSADVRAFSHGLIEVARNMLYWIHADLDTWVARYMPDEVDENTMAELRDALKRPLVITLPADQSESLPGMQIQAAQMILGMIVGLPQEMVMLYLPLVPDLIKTIITNLSLGNKNELLEKLRPIEEKVMAMFEQMGLGVPMGDGTGTDELGAIAGVTGMAGPTQAPPDSASGTPAVAIEDILAANAG